jgi:hypothetical protein
VDHQEQSTQAPVPAAAPKPIHRATKRKLAKKGQKGFSLLELVVVVIN